MRDRSARRLSVLPARTQLSSVERSSGVKVRVVGYLLMPHHDIERVSLQLSTSSAERMRSHGIPACLAMPASSATLPFDSGAIVYFFLRRVRPETESGHGFRRC